MLKMLKNCDFLGFNHKAVNLMYLENIVRYSPYYINVEGFVSVISQIIFSDKALLSASQDLAQKSSILLVRVCEKIAPQQMQDAEAIQQIVENILKVIDMIESGQ